MIYNLVTGVFERFGLQDQADMRVTVGKSVPVVRQPGPAGEPGSKRKRQSRLHKGTQVCCQHCNPAGYIRARILKEKLEGRSR